MPEIPVVAFQLMHTGFDLVLSECKTYDRESGHYLPNGEYYAEFTRWGMSSNGSQRRRQFACGGGSTITEAVEEAAEWTMRRYPDFRDIAA